ncbi:condensation domain-containing protein [Streptomyces luteocolor]|uniref:condensation domain-containing protein n=1 Tax=Streptomyces luteocolor TaxID=285500 RepID=UPI000852DF5E|nr:condensation domain-containing protein [Streptomyces luteocolor]
MQHTSTDLPSPQSRLTDVLLPIFGAHLRAPDLSPDDDFYARGGDSLIALKVVSDAQEQGVAMSLRDLLYFPSVRELAAHLAAESGAPAADATEPAAAEPAAAEPFALLGPSDRGLLPRGVVDATPATALQVGMVYLCEASGDPELYHSLIGWETVAPFDEELFRRALDDLVRRHPALRSSFDLGSLSVPVQLFWETADVPVTVERVTGPDAARERTARWRERRPGLPIDWGRAPLFRCHVVAGDGFFHVTLAFHHTVVDGWSYGRLIVDLLTLYDARLGGTDAGLAPQPGTVHHDFVRAEQESRTSEAAAAHWREQADVPALLLQRGQFSGAADAVAEDGFELPADLMERLREAARDLGVPLKALALAAHARALADWKGRERDVTTGVVLNARPDRPGADLVVGLYLNTVPLRFRSLAGSWADLARTALAAERNAMPYRAFPLAEIETRLGRPAFDTTFNFTHFHIYRDAEALPSLTVRSWWVRGKPSFPFRVDFEVDSSEAGGSRVVVAFDPALVDPGDARRYAHLFEAALHAAATDPHARPAPDATRAVTAGGTP